MSVWLTIPSARAPEEAVPLLDLWRERGYKIALWCDTVADAQAKKPDYFIAAPYPGYARAVNSLVHDILGSEHTGRLLPLDHAADWFVIAGDDVEPDLTHSADEIAEECARHFSDPIHFSHCDPIAMTFGVMQPTGDRWGANELWAQLRYPDAPAYIDRICGSAWFGREYCRRMYGGRGPLFDGYYHMYVDEEAQEVAKLMGVFWQRRDLTQTHLHWARKRAYAGDCPAFLYKANSAEHWQEAGELFRSRKAAGFPGHEPIP